MPVGLVTTCRHLLIVGDGRDIVPRIRHAKLFDWHRVTVMWPEVSDDIREAASGDARFTIAARRPTEEDVAAADVIVEDCGDPGLAGDIAAWARRHRRLVNAVDSNELCDLYYMSLIFRDPLIVAITSGGDAPSLAVRLRKHLEQGISPGWSAAAQEFAALRKRLPCGQDRKNLLILLASNERLFELIEAGDRQAIKDLIDDAVQRI